MAKKRKSQMLMDLSNNQPIMGATSPVAPVAPVALLIDGENVMAPELIAHILVEAHFAPSYLGKIRRFK